jgi:hypothetical protein
MSNLKSVGQLALVRVRCTVKIKKEVGRVGFMLQICSDAGDIFETNTSICDVTYLGCNERITSGTICKLYVTRDCLCAANVYNIYPFAISLRLCRDHFIRREGY